MSDKLKTRWWTLCGYVMPWIVITRLVVDRFSETPIGWRDYFLATMAAALLTVAAVWLLSLIVLTVKELEPSSGRVE